MHHLWPMLCIKRLKNCDEKNVTTSLSLATVMYNPSRALTLPRVKTN